MTNVFDQLNRLANRPECPHGLNGPCRVCGLPPHDTRLPEELWPDKHGWCIACGGTHAEPVPCHGGTP